MAEAVHEIETATLQASVSNIFLPGSYVSVQLAWRNVTSLHLTLHAIDLTRDVKLGDDESSSGWLARVDLHQARTVRTWSHDVHDDGIHKPGSTS